VQPFPNFGKEFHRVLLTLALSKIRVNQVKSGYEFAWGNCVFAVGFMLFGLMVDDSEPLGRRGGGRVESTEEPGEGGTKRSTGQASNIIDVLLF
jgi:hypothetical protein